MKKVLLSLFIAGSINASDANLSPYLWRSCTAAFGVAYKADLKTSLLGSIGIAVARPLIVSRTEHVFAHGVQEVAVASACAVFGHLVRKAAVKQEISEKKAALAADIREFYADFDSCRRWYENDEPARKECMTKSVFARRIVETKSLEKLNEQLNRK